MKMDNGAGVESPSGEAARELELYTPRRTLRRSPAARTIKGVGLAMIAMMIGLTLYALGIKSRHARPEATMEATREPTRPGDAAIENLPYHLYSTRAERPSVYAPGVLLSVETHVRCPRCDKQHPPLEHGHATQCECGLHMQRFGNSLHIWDPSERTARQGVEPPDRASSR